MARTTQLAIILSIFAVALRFIAVDQPYIDNWSWRQSDVAAIARNYLRNGFHFAYPQIDWAGDQPGYVGTEFPLLPFIAANAYKAVGVHEWIGRVESVLLFAVSLPFFFSLVREVFGATAAIWALIFYSFAPLSVFTSREFMPDISSLSVGIIGLWLFVRWLANARSTILVASALCVSLSILLKLTNIVIAAPIVCLAFPRFRILPLGLGGAFQRFDLWLFAAIALLPSLCWYWHAATLAQNFYPHHFFGAGGIRVMSTSWYWRIVKQMTTASLTPVLTMLALAGAILVRRNPRACFLHCWLGAMLLFIVVAGYGSRHQWYQLPLVPIAAAFASAACAFTAGKIPDLRIKVGLSILLGLSFGALSLCSARPLYRSSAAALRDAGLELQQSTPDKSLIVAADDGDPTMFYYARRKGWHFPEKNGIYDGTPGDDQQLIVDLTQLRERGATHLVFTGSTIWWLDAYPTFAQDVAASATLLQRTPEFTIYKFSKALP
jgi:4-amino-4-deoxy-L-arabinose transferase-like glycosyltransferase